MMRAPSKLIYPKFTISHRASCLYCWNYWKKQQQQPSKDVARERERESAFDLNIQSHQLGWSNLISNFSALKLNLTMKPMAKHTKRRNRKNSSQRLISRTTSLLPLTSAFWCQNIILTKINWIEQHAFNLICVCVYTTRQCAPPWSPARPALTPIFMQSSRR